MRNFRGCLGQFNENMSRSYFTSKSKEKKQKITYYMKKIKSIFMIIRIYGIVTLFSLFENRNTINTSINNIIYYLVID